MNDIDFQEAESSLDFVVVAEPLGGTITHHRMPPMRAVCGGESVGKCHSSGPPYQELPSARLRRSLVRTLVLFLERLNC